MKKFVLGIIWFPSSLILLLVNISLLRTFEQKPTLAYVDPNIISPLGDTTPYHLAASSSHTSQVLGSNVIAGDARAPLLEEFLKEYDSPLAPYANLIVEEADKNGIDFRLLVAIAMCESNLGKRIPEGSSNAWGIAVYTGQNSGAVFDGWENAIVWVSKYMKDRYISRGIHTLREIGAIYAPPSVNTGHSWSNCVDLFQKSIF